MRADAEAVPVFGALAGREAAAHAGLAQVLDQGDILDRVVLEGRLGEVAGDAEGVRPVDDVVGKEQVMPAAQTLNPIGRVLQPAAQVHPGGVHIFDGHVAHGEVMVDVAVHAARRADAVVEPVLDLQVIDDDVGGGAAVAQHQAAVAEVAAFFLDDRSFDVGRQPAARIEIDAAGAAVVIPLAVLVERGRGGC